MTGLMVVMLMFYKTCGESGFSYVESWSYSKEWVWRLEKESMLHCFREVKCQQDDTSRI